MEAYPNIWPNGGWFGFSGVDGETLFDEPFVLRGREDEIGWNLMLGAHPKILVTVGTHRIRSKNGTGDFVLPDCWHCSVRHGEHRGVVEGVFIDRSAFALVTTFKDMDAGEHPDIYVSGQNESDETHAVSAGEGWWIAVRKSEPGSTRQFGIGLSYESAEDADNHAKVALEADLRAQINKRLGFHQLAHVPESIVDVKRRAYLKAAGVLKMNVESPQGRFQKRWFRSDPVHHRRARLFDTVFYALGLQYVHSELANDAIGAALSAIQPDGRVPLAFGPDKDKGFSPEYTHPPLIAWTLAEQFSHTQDITFARKCYPALQRYIAWFEENRKRPNGLYGWKVRTEDAPPEGARGAESAMSNSPRFDSCDAVTAIDLSSYMAAEYRGLEILALELGHADEAAHYRENRMQIAGAVNELLWDSQDMFYYDLDQHDEMITIKTTAGFTPMLAQIPDRDQAEALRTHLMHPHEFWTPTPLPSVAKDEMEHGRDMWRGAMMPTMNALIYRGLLNHKYYEEAHELARRTVNEISYRYALTGCLFEYYDPQGSELPSALPRRGYLAGAHTDGIAVVTDHQPTAAAYVYLTQQLTHP